LDAKSHVKAMGLWQFMPQTGKIFGLENNLYVDERMDFVKSTYAATKYLKRLHEKFGKWYLAAMAYNSGEGRVIEAITRATIDLYVEQNGSKAKKEEIARYRQIISNYQSKKVRFRELYQVYKEVKTWGITPDIYTLLSVQNKTRRQYVPNETREYIRKIVALGMMNNKSFISNDDAHLLNMGNTTTSIATVKVKGGMHLQSVASAIGMDYKELAKLNLHIKEYIIPPFVEEYDIYIPYSTLSRFNLNKDQIKNDRFTIYQVKAGDSLASIGKKYKIAYSIIKDFNQLKSNVLSVNQKLIVPILNEKNQRVTQQTVSSSKVKSYYVKNGDTLYSISQRYNIALEKLMRDNNLKNSSINIGDKLVFNY
jgi:membrane-bound lytic murein transglycosylase D